MRLARHIINMGEFLNINCEISGGHCPSEDFSAEDISAVSKGFNRVIRYN